MGNFPTGADGGITRRARTCCGLFFALLRQIWGISACGIPERAKEREKNREKRKREEKRKKRKEKKNEKRTKKERRREKKINKRKEKKRRERKREKEVCPENRDFRGCIFARAGV